MSKPIPEIAIPRLSYDCSPIEQLHHCKIASALRRSSSGGSTHNPLPNLIVRARKYVAKCPAAVSGQGGHDATFHVASVLVHGFALAETDALTVLREWNCSCIPPWSEPELVHKVRSAANATHREARGYLIGAGAVRIQKSEASSRETERVMRPTKPSFCPMVLKRVAAKAAVADVVAFVIGQSPVRVEAQDPASVLRWLYRPGSAEKVLIFTDMKSQGQMLWDADQSDRIQSRHLPTGDDGTWFLAQPVDGKFHPNPRLNGKRSRRSEESVTAWRYAVLESDEAEIEDWLRCLIQMPLPIASICESGGRSIHALVRVDAESKGHWDTKVGRIKPALVTLGADPGALSAVRLTRLPQANRGDRVQRLFVLESESR